ncbi:ribosomal-protein-alanine acetyltransferase [Chondrocystis sp. NIES-4102]|nr:ribosomal-protein-alanine acetyltransferase [Chondrocystis sp. NIES-4102]
MKTITIKPISLSQVPTIVSLDQLCLGGIWTSEGYISEIESPNSNLLGLHILDENYTNSEIIGMGCLWVIADEAHITLLAIHPDYRRQGLGQLLLLTLLESAVARNLNWATLEVNAHNDGAINLYEKLGFNIIGKRKKYYKSTGDDALVLWLKNLQTPNFRSTLNQYQQETKLRLSYYQYCLN